MPVGYDLELINLRLEKTTTGPDLLRVSGLEQEPTRRHRFWCELQVKTDQALRVRIEALERLDWPDNDGRQYFASTDPTQLRVIGADGTESGLALETQAPTMADALVNLAAALSEHEAARAGQLRVAE